MDECARQRKRLADEFSDCRKIFIALGDENRQLIFITLLSHDTVGMRVPDITAKTHLSRPAVSHHLGILKEAGLISMHRVGTKHYYYVDAAESRWQGLRKLVLHVDEVVSAAKSTGYPNFREEE